MRFSTLLLAGLFLPVSVGNVYSQSNRISLKKSEATVEQVLDELEAKSGYSFLYNNTLINVDRQVSISADATTLEAVLNDLFAGTGVTYKIVNRQVILSPNPMAEGAQQTVKHVTGQVLDKTGETIVGANVIVKGTTQGTITDLDGKFALDVPQDAILEISFIGYNTLNQPVGNQDYFKITLKEDTEVLEEVVVVGYGTSKKSSLTGAVSSVNMDDVLGDRPIGSASKVLESAVPGLQISSASGKPGAGINMNIRGVTSISGGAPLVLVDNIPMDLEMIDPNDIESVSVLKDASASAIYGARAAYGVILVETKKGKKNLPISMNYSNNFSFSSPASLPQKLTPLQTVQTYADLGITSYFGGQEISKWLGFFDEYNQGKHSEGYVIDQGIRYNLAETDAFDNMMETGFQQQHNVSLSGGGDNAFYRASFGMIDQDGILYGSKDTYKRYNVNAFVNMDVNSWLSGQIDYKYSKSNNVNPVANVENSSAFWQYCYKYQPMGPLGFGYNNNDESTELAPYYSPRNMLTYDSSRKNSKTISRILGRLILKPFKGMVITGEYSFYEQSGGGSYAATKYEALLPTTNVLVPSLRQSSYETNSFNSQTNAINVFGTYTTTLFDDHHLKLMAGFNQESYHYENLWGKRHDIIDQNLPSLSLSSGTQFVSDSFSEYALRSGFYRVNYDYKDRYLVEINGRYDGSSRFAKNNRFGFFPSFSAGWRLAEEKFMNFSRDVVDNLKLRVSWGQIGNQNVANYGYLPTMNSFKAGWILPGDSDNILSMGRPGLVSNNYTWETVQTTNIGLDFGLFNNRLSGTFEYYIRETKDMLAPASAAPSVLGAAFPKTNSANLRTNGWEINVQWKDRINQDWAYHVGLNLYDSQSEITKYENSQGILLDGGNLVLREGMKYGEIWGYVTDRFYTHADFDDKGQLLPNIPKVQGVTRPNPGDVVYKDFNGDGLINAGKNTISDSGDMTLIGNNTARYQFNVNGGFTWKNLDVSFIFSGVGKRDLVMPGYWAPAGRFCEAIFDWQTNYWTEENTDSYWPRIYGAGGNNSANSRVQTKYLQNGAYLRLKNITVAYNFPKAWCNALHIKSLKAYVNGENLYTWHHLPKGYYPDMYTAVPGTLSQTSGIQADGAGSWSYPLMRQFSFGLNLNF